MGCFDSHTNDMSQIIIKDLTLFYEKRFILYTSKRK